MVMPWTSLRRTSCTSGEPGELRSTGLIELSASSDVALLLSLIDKTPEFEATSGAQLIERLAQDDSLALIASEDGCPMAYKIGYRRWSDGSWYSWLGAVLPSHRGQGVAQQLLEEQERWVSSRGYSCIRVKTRNRFVGMRILLARNGYELVELRREGFARPDYRLLLEKSLERAPAAKD